MSTLTIGDERLSLTLTRHSDRIEATLHDLVSKHIWGPAPLLVLEVYDKMHRCIEVRRDYTVDVFELLPNGLHIAVTNLHVTVGLWFEIKNGELVVRLPMPEVYERWADIFRLYTMDILPGLMTVGAGGKLLLPIVSGVLCDPTDKPKLADRFMIYGEQERWEILPLLPLCAVGSPAGGLAVLATQCAAEAQCRVETDGRGAGHIGLGFSFRRTWIDPVDPATRELRYVPIAPGADLVVTAAKRLRRHAMDDLGKRTLQQRFAEEPTLAYAANAYTIKFFHGIEHDGFIAMNVPKPGNNTFHNMMTFAEAGEYLQQLHDIGIDKVYTQNIGWNARGHDGMYPTRFPVEERLGGERGFRDFIALGKRLGYQISVHDNYIDCYRCSPDYNEEYVIHDVHGEPMIKGWWGGGISYVHWAKDMPESMLSGQMERIKALGIAGPYYCDAIGNPLELNYHPRHRGSRSGYAQGVSRILDAARRVFGSSGAENAFLYTVIDADYMAHVASDLSWKKTYPAWGLSGLCDKVVPLWHLALHGLILHEVQGVSWRDAMKGVLYGCHPRDEWAKRSDTISWPLYDDNRPRALKAIYDLCIGRFGRLQSLEMTNWQESPDGTVTSTFEDGTTVAANFDKETLFVNGQKIERPQGL